MATDGEHSYDDPTFVSGRTRKLTLQYDSA
jgi:hypothetical protein